jgi:hypothetical protein
MAKEQDSDVGISTKRNRENRPRFFIKKKVFLTATKSD